MALCIISYVDLGLAYREHCLKLGFFSRACTFLGIVGVGMATDGPHVAEISENPPPRWQSYQQRGFTGLRLALCKLVRSCSVIEMEDYYKDRAQPNEFYLRDGDDSENVQHLLPLPHDIRQIVFSELSMKSFIMEVLLPIANTEDCIDCLRYCAWLNRDFSTVLIDAVLSQLARPDLETKPLLSILQYVLGLNDNLKVSGLLLLPI